MQVFIRHLAGGLAAAVIPAALGLSLLSGCTATTETGYEPKRLGMSDAQIKGLYAPAFTPESRAAENNASPQAKGEPIH